MDMIKLNQIEELLNTLITIIQQKLQNNDSYGIVTRKRTTKNFTYFSQYIENMGKQRFKTS